jgi:hypothetical protein
MFVLLHAFLFHEAVVGVKRPRFKQITVFMNAMVELLGMKMGRDSLLSKWIISAVTETTPLFRAI